MQPDRKAISAERAQAHLDGIHTGARFVRDGVTVRHEAPLPLYDRAGQLVGIRVHATAARGGERLPVGDGWHHFVNPPTQVPDSAGGFRVDPVAAFQAILFDSIMHTARALGWQG